MTVLFVKLFGANWRTAASQIGVALFSLLTVLAALPYQLGDVSLIIPPAWKSRVFIVGAIATALLRVINGLQQKDKYVTGGVVQQTQNGLVASNASQLDSSSVNQTLQSIPKQ